MSYGLVFAGGGVRGSYELGVWKALEEMNIQISGAAGVSIGSINAALFVQGDFDTADRLWRNIRMEDIIKADELKSNNLFSVRNMAGIAKEIYNNQGLDVSPLEDILHKIISEDKIRKSKMNFGLCTYSLSDRKEIELFKEDMPKGAICDYLMASACLIGFRPRKIGGKTFLDGGINNNMPVNMLIDKGCSDIIAVDVGGVGLTKPYDDTGVNLIQISCEQCMVGMMEFDSDSISKNIKKGYYDCNKVFGRLCGDKFYFNTMSYFRARRMYSQQLLEGIEAAGEIFGIDPLASYSVGAFIRGVLTGYKRARRKYADKLSEKQNLIDLLMKTRTADEFALVSLIELMKNEANDLAGNKIITNLLGGAYRAANSVIYFMNKS